MYDEVRITHAIGTESNDRARTSSLNAIEDVVIVGAVADSRFERATMPPNKATVGELY